MASRWLLAIHLLPQQIVGSSPSEPGTMQSTLGKREGGVGRGKNGGKEKVGRCRGEENCGCLACSRRVVSYLVPISADGIILPKGKQERGKRESHMRRARASLSSLLRTLLNFPFFFFFFSSISIHSNFSLCLSPIAIVLGIFSHLLISNCISTPYRFHNISTSLRYRVPAKGHQSRGCSKREAALEPPPRDAASVRPSRSRSRNRSH